MCSTIKKSSNADISEAQRKCLSHILRNCGQAIEGVLALVEDPYSSFSSEDISNTLGIPSRQLDELVKAAQRESFCPLTENDCKLFSSAVGCEGKPDLGTQINSRTLKVL